MHKKYNIIYADPPWPWKTWSEKGRGRCADKHYPYMDLDEIKNLPIREIAAANCILFLWVTFPLLKEELEVMEAWGFKYKGLGFYGLNEIKNQMVGFGD